MPLTKIRVEIVFVLAKYEKFLPNMVKLRKNEYSVRFRWIFAVYGFGLTGLNIRLNGSVDSVWTPYLLLWKANGKKFVT